MTVLPRSTVWAVPLCLGALAWSTPGFADSRQDFLAALTESWRAVGASEVKIGPVTGPDNRFTVETITISVEDGGKTNRILVGPTTFVDARVGAGQSYSVAELIGTTMTLSSAEALITLQGYSVTNYEAPSLEAQRAAHAAEDPPPAKFDAMIFRGIEFKDLTEQKVSTIEAVSVTAANWVKFSPRELGISIKTLNAALDEKESSDLRKYGYDRLVMDFDSRGRWDDTAGVLALERFDINLRDMGVLKLQMKIGGYTTAVAEELSKLSTQGDEAQSRMMEILQGLDVQGGTMRFENASIVEKVIAEQAKEAGVSTTDFIGALTGGLPLMLAQLRNKAFEREVTTAVSAFLKGPKSISITLNPKAPIPVAQIVGSAMMNPQTLPGLLAASVKAND